MTGSVVAALGIVVWLAGCVAFILLLGWRARRYEYKARQANPDDERPAVAVPLELEAAKS